MTARRIFLAACCLIAAACSDPVTQPTEPVTLRPAPSGTKWVIADPASPSPILGAVHANVTGHFAAINATIPDTQKIRYHSGPIANTGLKLVAIYWSNKRIYKNGPL